MTFPPRSFQFFRAGTLPSLLRTEKPNVFRRAVGVSLIVPAQINRFGSRYKNKTQQLYINFHPGLSENHRKATRPTSPSSSEKWIRRKLDIGHGGYTYNFAFDCIRVFVEAHDSRHCPGVALEIDCFTLHSPVKRDVEEERAKAHCTYRSFRPGTRVMVPIHPC